LSEEKSLLIVGKPLFYLKIAKNRLKKRDERRYMTNYLEITRYFISRALTILASNYQFSAKKSAKYIF